MGRGWHGKRPVGEPSPPYAGDGTEKKLKLTAKGKKLKAKLASTGAGAGATGGKGGGNGNTFQPIEAAKATPAEFHAKINSIDDWAKALVTVYSEDDYKEIVKKGGKLRIVSVLGKPVGGYGIKSDGELISVFKLPTAIGRVGNLIAEASVKDGAKWLSCYGKFLKKLYGEAGFVTTSEDPFNHEYANDFWTSEKGELIERGIIKVKPDGTEVYPNYLEMKLKPKKTKKLRSLGPVPPYKTAK